MNKKVYCFQCEYYDGAGACFAPRNLKEKSNWERIKMIPIDPPIIRNRNNDCIDFLPTKNPKRRIT